MRIAYMKGLEEVAKTLTEFGHEIVPIEVAGECDAVLCDGSLPKVRASKRGTLYLMAREMTPEAMDRQVRRRLYTDLFE